MVASGLGVTVLPQSSIENRPASDPNPLAWVPFTAPAPTRRIGLVWRRTFPRLGAIRALHEAILRCGLRGVRLLETELSETETA